MSALVPLFLAIWTMVSSQLGVTHLDGPVHFTDLYGNVRSADAALACAADGRPELYLSPDVTLDTVIHELAHAYDCLDDGTLNGSPMTRPAERPSLVSDYCWQSDAEWYACSVVRYRSVFPDDVAPWGNPRETRSSSAAETRR